jgi:predicted Ser/Thr protein kinase
MKIDNVLKEHSLTIVEEVKKSAFKKVFLLNGNSNKKFILKVYRSEKQQKSKKIEKNFLNCIKHKKFDFLIFPEIVAYGDSFLLMNYIQRFEFNKSTIQQKEWTRDNIKLIVSALQEFQNIKVPVVNFSIEHRLLGSIIPPMKLAFLVKNDSQTTKRSQRQIFRLILKYMQHCIRFRKTLSHNDLQISNFTFHTDQKKMSMLDFERLHYLGDPFLDILHYLITASYKIEKWSFQSEILKEYINYEKKHKNSIIGLYDRIKLILLLYSYNYFLSVKNHKIKKAYSENISFLLSGSRYNQWMNLLTTEKSNQLLE